MKKQNQLLSITVKALIIVLIIIMGIKSNKIRTQVDLSKKESLNSLIKIKLSQTNGDNSTADSTAESISTAHNSQAYSNSISLADAANNSNAVSKAKANSLSNNNSLTNSNSDSKAIAEDNSQAESDVKSNATASNSSLADSNAKGEALATDNSHAISNADDKAIAIEPENINDGTDNTLNISDTNNTGNSDDSDTGLTIATGNTNEDENLCIQMTKNTNSSENSNIKIKACYRPRRIIMIITMPCGSKTLTEPKIFPMQTISLGKIQLYIIFIPCRINEINISNLTTLKLADPTNKIYDSEIVNKNEMKLTQRRLIIIVIVLKRNTDSPQSSSSALNTIKSGTYSFEINDNEENIDNTFIDNLLKNKPLADKNDGMDAQKIEAKLKQSIAEHEQEAKNAEEKSKSEKQFLQELEQSIIEEREKAEDEREKAEAENEKQYDIKAEETQAAINDQMDVINRSAKFTLESQKIECHMTLEKTVKEFNESITATKQNLDMLIEQNQLKAEQDEKKIEELKQQQEKIKFELAENLKKTEEKKAKLKKLIEDSPTNEKNDELTIEINQIDQEEQLLKDQADKDILKIQTQIDEIQIEKDALKQEANNEEDAAQSLKVIIAKANSKTKAIAATEENGIANSQAFSNSESKEAVADSDSESIAIAGKDATANSISNSSSTADDLDAISHSSSLADSNKGATTNTATNSNVFGTMDDFIDQQTTQMNYNLQDIATKYGTKENTLTSKFGFLKNKNVRKR